MKTDWKKVADGRLKELRRLQGANEILFLDLQQHLYRELLMQLHARCISRAGELADEVSVAVAAAVARS